MTSLQSTVSQSMPTETSIAVVIPASNPFPPAPKPHTSLAFSSRGTAGEWYEDGINYQTVQDPGPSSFTYGPELWKARRAAWLLGDLELNPPAPKVAMSSEDDEASTIETSSIRTRDSRASGGATTPTSSIAGIEDTSKPLMSTIQQLSAKARGKLPSFLHLSYTAGNASPVGARPRDPPTPGSPTVLSSLDKLELLMAEPGADENEKVWRQGGLEAVWRMLTDSKTLKQPMRLGLVVRTASTEMRPRLALLIPSWLHLIGTNPQGRVDSRWHLAVITYKGWED
ncbi:hypothetical protein QFC21_000676 [Naganishia friedmannii]|uniref:Uncharacterized protein n=1 Tax=Naganishia friedmannii TaxID=89922 RepID=A0ACC2WE53_9TREE|nr:hypothetical protein QFC21_000676 [Naganishia friedmannii]